MIMKVTSAQKEYGSGYAWLDLRCEARDEMRIIVERDTDKDRFLGASGWQNTPEELTAAGAGPKGLLLGPQIVDLLRDGDYVTFSVPMAQFEETDFWPSIPISGRKTVGDGMVAGIPKIPARAGVNASPPMANQTAVGPSVDDDTLEAGGASAEVSKFPRRGLALTLVGLVVLALLIGGGYFVWAYQGQWLGEQQARLGKLIDSALHPGGQQSESATSATPQTAPAQARAPTSAANAGTPATAARGAEYWGTILRDSAATPQQLFDAAQQTAQENLPDLSGEFLYQAALHGHKDAERKYAEIHDPTSTTPPPAGVSKNAQTALEFYSKLTAAGDQAAQAAVTRICASIKPDYYVNATARTAFDDFCH